MTSTSGIGITILHDMLIASFRYFYCLSARRAQMGVFQRHARFVDFLVKAAGVSSASARFEPIPFA
jgi:hypothetical protein